MSLKYQLRAFWIDGFNRLRYGAQAPRYAERVWIQPSACHRYIEAADLAKHLGSRVRQMSGKVVQKWPSELEQPFENHPKLTYCWNHWRDGQDWNEAGAIGFMLSRIAVSPTGVTDHCRTPEDVQARFDNLDRIRDDVLQRGRFPSRQELDPGNYREVGGILMHLGPEGEPIFSGAGCHRFAIAMLMDQPFPAQLGCVHESALQYLPGLRRTP
ncbi:hypothetical protein MLC59_11405 [Marinobacter bryozoorum]|uniref:hypothetical protein n=1 Tax=Marinobacter bryozoorum TaxID=256324 RepID=UPI002002DD45|nr:hypothetical protein [Marinobacter bryozoorum]MCK7544775.1 hypothetical protein [Marinobacter bryozoorum]